MKKSAATATPKSKPRIHEFDLLRGLFIVIIVIDHLQRWPSPLSYITGEGRLWVSAAEGFFIISGLLIGYLRGYKGRSIPMGSLTRMLLKRAGILYIWSVIITFVAVGLIALSGSHSSLLPIMPDTTGLTYIWQVLSQQYVFDWIYFLRLYWIMLLLSPLAVLVYRIGKWWLVPLVSCAIYAFSLTQELPEAALQWQVLFFLAVTIGFHVETIRDYLRARKKLMSSLLYGAIAVTIITMVLSYFWVLGWDVVESNHTELTLDTYVATRSWLDVWFTKSPLAIGRVGLSFIWFGGIFAAFHLARPIVDRYAKWLLTPLGTYSLTAYCVQSILLIGLQIYLPISDSWLLNTLYAIGAVLLVRVLTTQRHIHRVLPR